MDDILGLDGSALDRARIGRDPRFDGRFFIAVTTTGIYCRPICPVRSPRIDHIRYYATAAAAAEAGFRPCLRCRPEAAPGTSAWLGTSAVVRRALRLIEDGALDGDSVAALAGRLGIGPRHLRRLFLQHVGASPIAVAQTRRLHFAKRLLDDTSLSITEIALAAGFGSLRRFNATFQATYGRTPRELRRNRPAAAQAGDQVVLRLAFRPPYDWPQVQAYLAARAVPGVERVDRSGYARTVASGRDHALVHVRPIDGEDALELRVRGAVPATLFHISSAARRMFDLAADPTRIALAFEPDPLLAPLVRARPGLRIVGAWDPFECAVRAVLGEENGDPGARRLTARLVVRAGRPIAGSDCLTHLFPTPDALAGALGLGAIGIGAERADAIRSLARLVVEGQLDLDGAVEEIIAALSGLSGVGARMAQYIALRSLGEPDAFPAGDAALERAAPASPLVAETWRPWRGYAAFHLWSATGDARRLDDGARSRSSRGG